MDSMSLGQVTLYHFFQVIILRTRFALLYVMSVHILVALASHEDLSCDTEISTVHISDYHTYYKLPTKVHPIVSIASIILQ